MCSPAGLSVGGRGSEEEEENLPQGGYSRAGDNMAKAAGTLEEHGRLPRVVWRTSADTALHCSSHTSFLWLRLKGLCTETCSLCLMHVNSAHRSRSDAVRHDNTLTKPICAHLRGLYKACKAPCKHKACCHINKIPARKDSIRRTTQTHSAHPYL